MFAPLPAAQGMPRLSIIELVDRRENVQQGPILAACMAAHLAPREQALSVRGLRGRGCIRVRACVHACIRVCRVVCVHMGVLRVRTTDA